MNTSAHHHYSELDVLKVAGIVTIVLIHAMRSPWHPHVSATEVWLGHVTRFGVPAFLFVSGFLYATTGPISAALTGRRLRRIAVPYAIATLLAWLLFSNHPGSATRGSLWLDLLLGSALGPFYYVPVIALLVLVTPLIARLEPRAIGIATGVLVVAQWFVDAATVWPLHIFWHIRSPLLWWGYFFLGWWVRLHPNAVTRLVNAHRSTVTAALAATLGVLTVLSGLEGEAPRLLVRTAAWLHVYAVLIFVLVVAAGGSFDSTALRFVSEATYTVYLFHLFFVYSVQALVPPPPGVFALLPVLLPWIAGLAGPLALVAVARSVLGRRSRDVLGA